MLLRLREQFDHFEPFNSKADFLWKGDSNLLEGDATAAAPK